MRTFVLIIILTTLLLIFNAPGCAYYQWYDNKGFVHYTQNDPPADAKTEDGSMWWMTEIDQEEEKKLIKHKIQQARLKIQNGNAPEPKPGKKPSPIEKDVFQEPDEEEPEADDNEGFSIPSPNLLKWWDSTRVDPGELSATLYGI